MRKMKDSGIEWIREIPEEWTTIRFKFLHEGMNTGESIGKEFWSEDISDNVFYTAGLEPIRTCYQNFPEWKYTHEKDLLLARNGTPYVYLPVSTACYSDHIIRATLKNNVNREFVRYSLQCSIASVVVDSVSLATWSASLWNEQCISWPNNDEQSEIVTYLDAQCSEIDALHTDIKKQIEILEQYKKSVITEAVTKGIRPNRKMKDSGNAFIGLIPYNWTCRHLNTLLAGIADGTHGTYGRVDDGHLLLSAKNVFEDGLRIDSHESQISEQDYQSIIANGYPQKGDVLLCCVGTVGRCMIYQEEKPYAFQRSIVFLRPNKDITSKILKYSLQCNSTLAQETLLVNQSAQAGLYQGAVKRLYLSVPPIEEQKEIADYLDAKCARIDALIAEKQQQLSKLGDYKKSLIYEYVTGKKEVPVQ